MNFSHCDKASIVTAIATVENRIERHLRLVNLQTNLKNNLLRDCPFDWVYEMDRGGIRFVFEM